jgi:hypothetical protein
MSSQLGSFFSFVLYGIVSNFFFNNKFTKEIEFFKPKKSYMTTNYNENKQYILLQQEKKLNLIIRGKF